MEITAELPTLRRFASRFARNRMDRDDLVQETVLRALRAGHQFQRGTALTSWLFTIMRNAFNAEYRRQSRELTGLDPSVFERASTGAPQEWSVRNGELRRALDRMPPKARKTLLLVAAGVSYVETARLCACEIGTVKSRVNLARKALERQLGRID